MNRVIQFKSVIQNVSLHPFTEHLLPDTNPLHL